MNKKTTSYEAEKFWRRNKMSYCMKRINRLLKMPCIAVALVAAILFSFAACTDDNTPSAHTHTFSTTWSSNATQHWKGCTVAGCNAKTETANHSPADGICLTCDYNNTPDHTHTYSTTWSSNATQHWKGCTVAGCNAKTETANHSPADGICNTCGYDNTPVSVEIVQIPSGTFTMGSPEGEADRYDETQHQVTISKGFYMGKYEVTQELYQTVTGVNPSNFSSNPATGEIQSRRPVERVTWYDAVEFCNKLSERESLTPTYTITDRFPTSGYPIASATVTVNWDANGYRLPTEAEWEYACRAGTTTAYNNTGNTLSNNTGWYLDNSLGKTHEVGKKPSAFSLHDMHGNVYEWCWDWYGSYASGAQTDPRGAASGSLRVKRGGSWGSYARNLRSAGRSYDFPYGRSGGIGFRVVRP